MNIQESMSSQSKSFSPLELKEAPKASWYQAIKAKPVEFDMKKFQAQIREGKADFKSIEEQFKN